jgi:hypothetical protein
MNINGLSIGAQVLKECRPINSIAEKITPNTRCSPRNSGAAGLVRKRFQRMAMTIQTDQTKQQPHKPTQENTL